MPAEEKPYRIYRGGRKKGKVPVPAGSAQRTAGERKPSKQKDGKKSAVAYAGPDAPKRSWWRRSRKYILLGVILLFVVFIAWAVAAYLAVASGVSDANKRLPKSARKALTHKGGLLLSHPTTILLLGTDNSKSSSRRGLRHSDSIELLRVDPSHHRISYLSIPRDLYVPVPGYSSSKINAAYQEGGPALAIRTIAQFTSIPINHIVIVNFNDFKKLIDAEGGITINVPKPILSNSFDCPFKAAKCANWEGWRFAKGKQHMNGQRALIYSRIRENRLDPAENDLTRGARQQAVVSAATSKLTSFSTILGLPFNGGGLVKPLATDLSASQLLQLGWVKFRSSGGNAVYCRLGGDGTSVDGQSVILPNDDNRSAVATFLDQKGASAPQAPTSSLAPGCVRGHPLQQ